MSTDDRDPRLREELEVEPLDEVTRRRLVRRALDAADAAPVSAPATARREDSWTHRWLPAAAAVILVLAVGGFVTAIVRNDSGHTTASNSESTGAPAQSPESPEDRDAEAAAPDAAPTNLGELGAAPSSARLGARAERALSEPATADTESTMSVACVAQFEPALAVASGALDDQLVTILVYDDRVLVVDATTCGMVSEVAR